MYRAWKARADVRALVGEVYKKLFDAGSGYSYYFNVRTGESSWTKPLARVLREGDLPMTPRTLAAVAEAYPPAVAAAL